MQHMRQSQTTHFGEKEARAGEQRVDRHRVMAEARTRTGLLIAEAPRLIGRSAASPETRFDLRGQAAGQFRMEAGRRPVIRYNIELLTRHPTDFLAQTVPHEVAHYLVYLRFGSDARPHGVEWRGLMRAMRADPSRCHSFDTSGLETRRIRRHPYHCDCADHELTSVRHNRILRGASYRCKVCGQALKAGHVHSARS
jgi:SprT protein